MAEQPKKAQCSYFLYLGEQRASIVEKLGEQAKTKGIVAKVASEQWRALSAEAKAPYEQKAAAGKAEYEKALESFKATGGEIVRKRKAGKDGKDKAKKDANAPKKPAGGGYGQFLAANREMIVKSLPAGSNQTTDVAKAAGAKWKALAEAEQKPYADKYDEKMKQFQAAMAEYKASKPAAPDEEDEEQESPPPKRAKKTADKTSSQEVEPAAKRGRPKATTGKPEKVGKATKALAEKPAKVGKPKACKVPELELDASVLAEATKLGFEDQLRNLAGRSDIQGLGKADKDLLAALQSSNGLVNPARRALLGA